MSLAFEGNGAKKLLIKDLLPQAEDGKAYYYKLVNCCKQQVVALE